MHPKAFEIAHLIRSCNLNINTTTNGILTDKIEKFVNEFKIEDVRVSLDGRPETHNFIRGVECYSKIIDTIKRLRNLGFVNLSINYTITPWNNRDDFIHVVNVARKYNVKVNVVIYENVKAFGTDFTERVTYDISDLIEDEMEREFFNFYFKWLNGAWLPCLSIRGLTLIMPNGDVRLCHCKDVILGNIYEQTFDEIWNSKRRKEIVKKYTKCNDCWVHCHRSFDLALAKKLGVVIKIFKLIN